MLPADAHSLTTEVVIAGITLRYTVTRYPNGAPGGIFVRTEPHGTALAGALDCWARAASLALQAGVALDEVLTGCRGSRFDPAGPTSDPAIPTATSPLAYFATWCARHWPPEDL